MTAESITIDGREYQVLVVYPSRLRSFTIVEGSNSGTSLSFRKIRDIGGTQYSYSMQIKAKPGHQEDYDRLYEAISAPVAYHRVIMPHGQETLEFDAAVYAGQDIDYGLSGEARKWSDLQLTFEPMEPQRRPGE